MGCLSEQAGLTLALLLVPLLEALNGVRVIAFQGGERLVGDPLDEQGRRGPEQRVAAHDVVLQERQGLAGINGLHPE